MTRRPLRQGRVAGIVNRTYVSYCFQPSGVPDGAANQQKEDFVHVSQLHYQGIQGQAPAGGQGALRHRLPHRGAQPVRGGELPARRRRPRTLQFGDSRRRRRRLPAGALPGGFLRPAAVGRPLPPRPGRRGLPRGRPPAPERGGESLVNHPAATGTRVPAPAHLRRRPPAGAGLGPPDLRHRRPLGPGAGGKGDCPTQPLLPGAGLVPTPPG